MKPDTDSKFAFVEQDVLRANLDLAFNLLLTLIPHSEAEGDSPEIQSSLRKQIIINAASIIEALLMLIIQKKKTLKELTPTPEDFKIKNILGTATDGKQIVTGDYIPRYKNYRLDKLNFSQVSELCDQHNLLRNPAIYTKLESVQELRNRMHIQQVKFIDNGYTESDIKFVLDVMKEIKEEAEEILTA